MTFFFLSLQHGRRRQARRFSGVAAQIVRPLLAVVVAFSGFALPACDSASPSPAQRSVSAEALSPAAPPGLADDQFQGRPFRTIEPRVYALQPPVGGDARSLIIPILLAPGVGPGDGVAVDLEDGRPLEARLARLGLLAVPVSREEARIGAWSSDAPAGEWIFEVYPTPVGQPPRLTGGGWLVEVRLPPREKPRVIRIDRTPVPLIWLTGDGEQGGDEGARLLRAAAARQWPAASLPASRRWLEVPALSPLSGWRAQLALGELAAADPDDLAEALRRQMFSRWSAAVARLAAVDAPAARELAERLLAGLRVAPGFIVPAWAPDGPELDRLLDALLDPSLTPDEVQVRARAWLGSQPRCVAWVMDDAGQSDAISGDAIATLGVANLGPEPALSWARAGDAPTGRMAEELRPAPPWGFAPLAAVCPVIPGEPATLALPVTVRVGGSQLTIPILAAPAPVHPPGLAIGPFAADWTMPRWLAGGTLPEGPRQALAAAPTAALLFRTGTGAGAGGGGGGGDGGGGDDAQWQIYLECGEPPATAFTAGGPGESRNTPSAPRGLVRVWIGPYGRPAAVYLISSEGALFDQTLESRSGPVGDLPAGRAARTVQVLREKDRWRCWVPIPAGCIGPDGLIRLGIERIDSAGRRSAWPRAMTPWQSEPGRASLDTRLWGAIDSRTP